jgi:DNA-directed RNA polymerase specialized sigma subunit
MEFNNGLERKKFNSEWEKNKEIYIEAGMSMDAINEIYEFDLKVFNSSRKYAVHTQPSLDENIDAENDPEAAAIAHAYMKYISNNQETISSSRFGWIEEIDNPKLLKKIKELSTDDLELLTLYVFEGFSQAHIAQFFGVNQGTICRKLQNIEKYLVIFKNHA